MKFQFFVFGFIKSYNPIDLYKIPLTFTEEFLSIISRKKDEISKYNIKYFGLIDELYSQRKLKNQNELNFMNINMNFFKNLKNTIDREICDRNKKRHKYDNTHMIQLTSISEKNYVYQTYELDDIILLN